MRVLSSLLSSQAAGTASREENCRSDTIESYLPLGLRSFDKFGRSFPVVEKIAKELVLPSRA